MEPDKAENDDEFSAQPQPPDEIELAIEAVAEEFLSRLRQGGSDNYEELVKKYPELAPRLEARLKIYLAIYRATKESHRLGRSSSNAAPDGNATASFQTALYQSVAIHIACPHCGHRVQVVGKDKEELLCQSCGSSIKVNSSSQRRAAALPMPAKLGRFRVIRPLGEGGFGVVYLAEDTQLEKWVAIKVPRRGYFTSADEEQRFFREARNVAKLQHPNIAQVHEISEDEEFPYIVSDFIDGWTLRDLNRDGNLDYPSKVGLLIQVAEAVHFAHTRHIIHRDLKSSNILVDHNHRAYVVDFGLSRRDDGELTMTVEGAVVGTVQYMSPEQAAGLSSQVGPLSDVYSLGVILYELLCNELPFHGSKHMIMDQVIHDEPRYPRRLKEGIPKDLETITLKAMAKDRPKRYASAQEFADDLRRWSRNEPILARPLSQFEHFLRWCSRYPAVASLAGVIVTLLCLTTAISVAWSYEQARLSRLERAARSESESNRYRLLLQNGTRALERNDLIVATHWFAEALTIKDNANARLRLGLIVDHLPKLNHLWSLGASIDDIIFNRDGSRLAVATRAGRIQVVDVATRRSIFDQHVAAFQRLSFSPAGAHLLSCDASQHVQLWNIDQNQLVKQLPHTDTVVGSAFHASEPLVATGSLDSHARIWNLSDGSLHSEHKFEDAQVIRVEFVPGRSQLLVVTKPRSETPTPAGEQVHVWDFQQDQVESFGQPFQAHVIAVEFGEQGGKAMLGSRDGEVRIIDTASGKAIGSPMQLPFSPRRILFGGSTEELLAITYDSRVEVWNIAQARREKPYATAPSNYASADLNASGSLLALGGNDGSIAVLWRASLQPATSLLHNGENASAVAFHPDGRRLAIGGREGVLQFWDLAGASATSQVFEHGSAVRNALLSPDGSLAYTVCTDGSAHIWSTTTGSAIDAQLKHASAISDCALSSDGKIFATGSLDKTIRLWDAITGSPLCDNLEGTSQVLTVSISPAGNRLVAAYSDGSLTCWDTKSVMQGGKSPLFTVRQEPLVYVVRFNRSGSLLAAASLSGDVRCWDSTSGRKQTWTFSTSPQDSRLLVHAGFRAPVDCGSGRDLVLENR